MLKRKLNRRGFTLTELVITISVIGIVAAIAIPAVKKAVAKANDAAAIAAIRVIAQGQNISFATTGAYRTLGQLNAANLTDERFKGIDVSSLSASANGFDYLITQFPAAPGEYPNYILSAKPSSTNPITRTGSRRFGVDKSNAIKFDMANDIVHFTTLPDLYAAPPQE